MMLYPVFFNLSGKRCLVVGGGRVAVRKVIALLRSDAVVTVIAKECCRRMRGLERSITLYERPFTRDDVSHDFLLVIGATDNPEVNRTIFHLSGRMNIPCNIVDQPALCSFIVPAQVRRGDISVAISTNAVSPRLSRYLKKTVAAAVEPLHGELAAYLGKIRVRIRTELPRITLRSAFWEALFADDPVEHIREKGWNSFMEHTETLIAVQVRRMERNEEE